MLKLTSSLFGLMAVAISIPQNAQAMTNNVPLPIQQAPENLHAQVILQIGIPVPVSRPVYYPGYYSRSDRYRLEREREHRRLEREREHRRPEREREHRYHEYRSY